MIRSILSSFLILLACASCTISKRQHLSGYHVDLHPALKKNASKSHTIAKSKDNVALDHDQLKDIKPLAKHKAPFNESSLSATIGQDLPTVDKASTRRANNRMQEINDPLILEDKKPRQVNEPKPPAAPAKAQTHKAFLIAGGIGFLLSVVFYLLIFASISSGTGSIVTVIFAYYGTIIFLVLSLITLTIGLILYLIYLSEKE